MARRPINVSESDDPLVKPFALGWKREILRMKATSRFDTFAINYITPDGLRLRSMDGVLDELFKTRSDRLTKANFTFDPGVIYYPPYEVMKMFNGCKAKGLSRYIRESHSGVKSTVAYLSSRDNKCHGNRSESSQPIRGDFVIDVDADDEEDCSTSSANDITTIGPSDTISNTPVTSILRNENRKRKVMDIASNEPIAKKPRLIQNVSVPDKLFYQRLRTICSDSALIFLIKLADHERSCNPSASTRKTWMNITKDRNDEHPRFVTTQTLKHLVNESKKMEECGNVCNYSMEVTEDVNLYKMPSKYPPPCSEYCMSDGSLPEKDCAFCQLLFHSVCSEKWWKTLYNANSGWLPQSQERMTFSKINCPTCNTYEIEKRLRAKLRFHSRKKVDSKLKLTFENPLPSILKKSLPNAICWLVGRIRTFPPSILSGKNFKLDSDLAATYTNYTIVMKYTPDFDRFLDQPEVIIILNYCVHRVSGGNFIRRGRTMTVKLKGEIVLSKQFKRIIIFCPLPSNEHANSGSGPMCLEIPTVDALSSDEEGVASNLVEEVVTVSDVDVVEKCKDDENETVAVDLNDSVNDDDNESESEPELIPDLPEVDRVATDATQGSGTIQKQSDLNGGDDQVEAANMDDAGDETDAEPCVAMDEEERETEIILECETVGFENVCPENGTKEVDTETNIRPVGVMDARKEVGCVRRSGTLPMNVVKESNIVVEVVSVGNATSGKNVGLTSVDFDQIADVNDSSITTLQKNNGGSGRTSSDCDEAVFDSPDNLSDEMWDHTENAVSRTANCPRYISCFGDLGGHRILDTIFFHLDTASLLRCRLVCRDWKRTIDSSPKLCGGRYSPRTGYHLTLSDLKSLFHWLLSRQVESVDLRDVRLSSSSVTNQFIQMVELQSALWPSRTSLTEVKLKTCSRALCERMEKIMPQLRILCDEWDKD